MALKLLEKAKRNGLMPKEKANRLIKELKESIDGAKNEFDNEDFGVAKHKNNEV